SVAQLPSQPLLGQEHGQTDQLLLRGAGGSVGHGGRRFQRVAPPGPSHAAAVGWVLATANPSESRASSLYISSGWQAGARSTRHGHRAERKERTCLADRGQLKLDPILGGGQGGTKLLSSLAPLNRPSCAVSNPEIGIASGS